MHKPSYPLMQLNGMVITNASFKVMPMCTGKPSRVMVLLDCIEVLESRLSIVGITLYRGLYFGIYDTMKPIVLVGPLEGNFLACFALGWSVTTFSRVCEYLFDTLRRRMMLASGQPSKYKNTFHASKHIISTEWFFALFRGVTANMLSRIAGAGVLAGYDQLHGFGLQTQLRGGLK